MRSAYSDCMAKEEEYFVIDSAYLRHQFNLALKRYFMWFNPKFWQDFAASEGPKAKFNTILEWPENAKVD